MQRSSLKCVRLQTFGHVSRVLGSVTAIPRQTINNEVGSFLLQIDWRDLSYEVTRWLLLDPRLFNNKRFLNLNFLHNWLLFRQGDCKFLSDHCFWLLPERQLFRNLVGPLQVLKQVVCHRLLWHAEDAGFLDCILVLNKPLLVSYPKHNHLLIVNCEWLRQVNRCFAS